MQNYLTIQLKLKAVLEDDSLYLQVFCMSFNYSVT